MLTLDMMILILSYLPGETAEIFCRTMKNKFFYRAMAKMCRYKSKKELRLEGRVWFITIHKIDCHGLFLNSIKYIDYEQLHCKDFNSIYCNGLVNQAKYTLLSDEGKLHHDCYRIYMGGSKEIIKLLRGHICPSHAFNGAIVGRHIKLADELYSKHKEDIDRHSYLEYIIRSGSEFYKFIRKNELSRALGSILGCGKTKEAKILIEMGAQLHRGMFVEIGFLEEIYFHLPKQQQEEMFYTLILRSENTAILKQIFIDPATEERLEECVELPASNFLAEKIARLAVKKQLWLEVEKKKFYYHFHLVCENMIRDGCVPEFVTGYIKSLPIRDLNFILRDIYTSGSFHSTKYIVEAGADCMGDLLVSEKIMHLDGIIELFCQYASEEQVYNFLKIAVVQFPQHKSIITVIDRCKRYYDDLLEFMDFNSLQTNICLKIIDKPSDNVLRKAIDCHNKIIIKHLVDIGAEVNKTHITDNLFSTGIPMILYKNLSEEDLQYALMRSVCCGSDRYIRFFIEKGVIPDPELLLMTKSLYYTDIPMLLSVGAEEKHLNFALLSSIEQNNFDLAVFFTEEGATNLIEALEFATHIKDLRFMFYLLQFDYEEKKLDKFYKLFEQRFDIEYKDLF